MFLHSHLTKNPSTWAVPRCAMQCAPPTEMGSGGGRKREEGDAIPAPLARDDMVGKPRFCSSTPHRITGEYQARTDAGFSARATAPHRPRTANRGRKGKCGREKRPGWGRRGEEEGQTQQEPNPEEEEAARERTTGPSGINPNF